MPRRDALERRPLEQWLTAAGAVVAIAVVGLVLTLAALDAGDEPPTAEAIAAWERSEAGGGDAGAVEVERCQDARHRLPARDPVTVYRCTVRIGGRTLTGCYGVDRRRVVAGRDQLAALEGCD